MPHDRAAVVTTTVLAMLRDHMVEFLNSPALRAELAKVLREEFADVARTTLNEIGTEDEQYDRPI
jgi:hypothetical protein